jgi:hypothetical protein
VLSSTSPHTNAKVHGLSFSSDSVLAYPPAAAAHAIERVSTSPEVEVVTLFNELRDRLLRYLLVLGLSAHDGEEIIQESFLLLFQHLKQGKSRQNLRGWVFRVARNLALKQRSSNQNNSCKTGSDENGCSQSCVRFASRIDPASRCALRACGTGKLQRLWGFHWARWPHRWRDHWHGWAGRTEVRT